MQSKPGPKPVAKPAPKPAAKAAAKPAAKADKAEPRKRNTPNKPASAFKGGFGSNIPEFLKVEVAHLIKGE